MRVTQYFRSRKEIGSDIGLAFRKMVRKAPNVQAVKGFRVYRPRALERAG